MYNRFKKYIEIITPIAAVSAIFLLLIFIYSLKSSIILSDSDFWWHLKAGELISTLGEIPQHDVFSFTMENSNYRWVNLSWLWDILYYYLYKNFGLYLPLVVTIIINATTLCLLIWFLISRQIKLLTILFCLIIIITPYSYMLAPRPHQVTFLMALTFYIILHRSNFSNNKEHLLFLPILMLVWVNMHGGFLVGFTIIGAYLLEALIKRDKLQINWLILILFLCLFSTLINPMGIDVYAGFFSVLSDPLVQFIDEWKPISLGQYPIHTLYIFLFFISFNPFLKNISVAEKILSVFWIISALQHQRNLPLAVLLSAPTLLFQIEKMINFLPERSKSIVRIKNFRLESDFSNSLIKARLFYINLLVVIFMLSSGGNILIKYSNINDTLPVKETEYLRNNYKNLRIINDYTQGGYLLYGLQGAAKIFIDGRAITAYSKDVINEFLLLNNCQINLDSIIKKYGIDGAMIPKNNSCLYLYFLNNKDWTLVFSGNINEVFIRSDKVKHKN